jgi:transposase
MFGQRAQPSLRMTRLRDEVRSLQAAIGSLRRELEQVVGERNALRERVAELEQRLGQDSSNSSRPPSSDPPWHKGKRKRKPSGRKRGGQPGHRGWFWRRVAVELVDQVHERDPDQCEGCGQWLEGKLERVGAPRVHQVLDVGRQGKVVTEWRLYRVRCSRCGQCTRAKLPSGVAAQRFGAGLVARIGLMTSELRLSRRKAQQALALLFGVRISLGALSGCEGRLSEALGPVYRQAKRDAQQAPVGYVDETGWSEQAKRAWLWVLSTLEIVVFQIQRGRSSPCARALLGHFSGTLVRDRHGAYRDYLRWQLCWAHIQRLFESIAQRAGQAKVLGQQLLEQAHTLFSMWHGYQRNEMDFAQLKKQMQPVEDRVEQLLGQGSQASCKKTARQCALLHKQREGLWTFVRSEGIEPTNNEAERQVRHGVMLRKISGGSQSERGSRYLERTLTVTASLRKRGGDVLAFLQAALEAKLPARAPPSLLVVG